MDLPTSFWHQRFLQQTRWTKELRFHLYKKFHVHNVKRILEVGCGTGSLVSEFGGQTDAIIFGMDINSEYLSFVKENHPQVDLIRGDAHQLPFADQSIDVTMCHFLLLWVDDPNRVLREMKRVTRQGMPVLALAEPDYGGRIDYPSELARIGELQKHALRSQGADPEIGRRLAEIFSQAGLQSIEVGVLGGQWKSPIAKDEWEREWEVIRNDLSGLVTVDELKIIQEIDRGAWEKGERILFVPTFYAIGYVTK